MIRTLVMCAALGLTVTIASAQTMQVLRPTAVAPAVNAGELVDYQARYAQAMEKNRQLRAENENLKGQLAEVTRLGGSRVMAYCESASSSRNTAGASASCAAAGYNCEPVSGQCHTSCQTSDMCAVGFVCDVAAARCVVP